MTEANTTIVCATSDVVSDARLQNQHSESGHVQPQASLVIDVKHEMDKGIPDANVTETRHQQEDESNRKSQESPYVLTSVVVRSSECEPEIIRDPQDSLTSKEDGIITKKQCVNGSEPVARQTAKHPPLSCRLPQAIQTTFSLALRAIPILVVPFLVISFLYFVARMPTTTLPFAVGVAVISKHCFHCAMIWVDRKVPRLAQVYPKQIALRFLSMLLCLSVTWILAGYGAEVLAPSVISVMALMIAVDLFVIETNGKPQRQSLRSCLSLLLQGFIVVAIDLLGNIYTFVVFYVLQGKFLSSMPLLQSFITGVFCPVFKSCYTIWMLTMFFKIFPVDMSQQGPLVTMVETMFFVPPQLMTFSMQINEYFWLTAVQCVLASSLPRLAVLLGNLFPCILQRMGPLASGLRNPGVHQILRFVECAKYAGYALAIYMLASVNPGTLQYDLLIKGCAILFMEVIIGIIITSIEIKFGFPQPGINMSFAAYAEISLYVCSCMVVFIYFLHLPPP